MRRREQYVLLQYTEIINVQNVTHLIKKIAYQSFLRVSLSHCASADVQCNSLLRHNEL